MCTHDLPVREDAKGVSERVGGVAGDLDCGWFDATAGMSQGRKLVADKQHDEF